MYVTTLEFIVAGIYLIFVIFRIIGLFFPSQPYVKAFNASLCLVFFVMGCYHLLKAIGVPTEVLGVELVFLAIAGVVNLILGNPYSHWYFVKYYAQLEIDSQIHQRKQRNSVFPQILLQWEDTNCATILRINTAAEEWFYKHKNIDRQTSLVGLNWHDIYPSNQEERVALQKAAIAGHIFDQLIEVQGANDVFYLQQNFYGIGEKKIVIEWHDATDLKERNLQLLAFCEQQRRQIESYEKQIINKVKKMLDE
jgi:hypothetical protein